MNDLSELLIKLRGSESGRKAAKRAGISHNYLAILEKGFDPQTKAPINPSPETLMSLAGAYGYPYEELMKIAGYLKREDDNESSIKESEADIKRKKGKELLDKIKDENLEHTLFLLEQLNKE